MSQLLVVEYQGARVLTTAQLADSYEADTKLISKNFERNESRYKEGKHYFLLSGEELRDFKASRQNDDTLKFVSILYLWTEKGAWLHAKSLNTDRAWEAYEMLVDEYYRVTQEQALQQFNIPQTLHEALYFASKVEAERVKLEEQNLQLVEKIQQDKPLVVFAESVQVSEDSILVREMARMLRQKGVDTGETRFYEYLRQNGYLVKSGSDRNLPTQKSMELGIMEVKRGTRSGSDGVTHLTRTTKITGKGQIYFMNKFLNKLPQVQ